MEVIADYHTHTIYSDGKGTMEENVRAALKRGLRTIGISDHGHQHMGFGMKYDRIQYMREEIDLLKEKYREESIEILLGVECNILDDEGSIDMDDRIRPYFDYIMAGYHFGSRPTHLLRGLRNHVNNYIRPLKHKEVDYNTRSLIESMRKNRLFVLTHPGDKGDIDIVEVAKVAVETNTLLEINARHQNLSVEQLQKIQGLKVRYIIGSDAHIPKNVGVFDRALERVDEAGIDISNIVNLKGGAV